MNYDEAVEQIAKAVTSHEHYQKLLGQIAYEVGQLYGLGSVVGLAEDLENTHGLKVSPNTLKNYEYTYRNTKDLNLPKDFAYRTLQYIASSNDPSYWATKIEKEGLSSAEVYRLIRLEKGLEDKKRVFICTHCGMKNLI